MSELLHLILKSSNALTKLSDCQIAAFNRKIIRCTLKVICDKSLLQSANCNVIRDKFEEAKVRYYCKCNVIRYEISKILHLMLKSSNALTILFVIKTAAFDAKIIECTDDLFNFRKIEIQRLSDNENLLQSKCNVIRDENACWCCKLID